MRFWSNGKGRRSRSRGIGLLEIVLGLGVAALMFSWIATQISVGGEQVRDRVTSDRLGEVHSAAAAYIRANYGTLVSQVPANGVIEIPVTGNAVGGRRSLKQAGFLPASFQNVNPFNQQHAILVRRLGENGLEVLVTTYGGREIPDTSLGRIATYTGAAGGFVQTNPPVAADRNVVQGAYGGWRSPIREWGNSPRAPAAGRLAATLAFEDGGLISDYLYRNDIGIPEANRMNTAIDMNSNDLNNAGLIQGRELEISEDGTVDGQLTAGRIESRSSIQAARPDAGQTWSMRALNGDIIAAAGNVGATLNVVAGQDMHANRNIRAENDITAVNSIYADNGDITAHSGSLNAGVDVIAHGGSLRARDDVEVLRDAVIRRDAHITGTINAGSINPAMSVVGREGTLGDLLPRMVPQNSFLVGHGSTVQKPTTCPGRERIILHRMVESARLPVQVQASGSFMGGISIRGGQADMGVAIFARHSGRFWQVLWAGNPETDRVPRQAIAQTYCFWG